jgi:flagellar motor switch/type III secretory pathway protein FliN
MRAVKLSSAGESPVRADTYAKLGRRELERARAHLDRTREMPESSAILGSIFVRVWVELGRTYLPLGRALELAQGAVVELDQAAEEPVELFANGLCFANARPITRGDSPSESSLDEQPDIAFPCGRDGDRCARLPHARLCEPGRRVLPVSQDGQ